MNINEITKDIEDIKCPRSVSIELDTDPFDNLVASVVVSHLEVIYKVEVRNIWRSSPRSLSEAISFAIALHEEKPKTVPGSYILIDGTVYNK